MQWTASWKERLANGLFYLIQHPSATWESLSLAKAGENIVLLSTVLPWDVLQTANVVILWKKEWWTNSPYGIQKRSQPKKHIANKQSESMTVGASKSLGSCTLRVCQGLLTLEPKAESLTRAVVCMCSLLGMSSQMAQSCWLRVKWLKNLLTPTPKTPTPRE